MAATAWLHGKSIAQGDGVVSHPHRDPCHHDRDDIRHAAHGLPWQVDIIGDWSHPHNQQLVRATLA